MTGYTKLFQDIVTSTIWGEDDKTRIVWITLLALKDYNHFVSASIPGLARQANVSQDDCLKALRKLESPDKFSRSKEHEGRRIKAVEGGWTILNGEKYRQRMSQEDRKAYQRKYQRDRRAKLKSGTPMAGESLYLAANERGDDKTAERVLDEVNERVKKSLE